jgi:hypothetical protein
VLLWLERARGASSEHEAPQRPKSIRMVKEAERECLKG